jgi:hypothetical protein
MIAVPPAAIGFAIVVSFVLAQVKRWQAHARRLQQVHVRALVLVVLTGVIVIQSTLVSQTRVVALEDGQVGWSCAPPAQEIVHYLAQYYDGGRILIDPSAVDGWDIGLLAGIDLKNYVYQGSGALWQQALSNPASAVDWVILNPYADDLVAENVSPADLAFRIEFSLVASELNGRSLYRRNSLPVPIERANPPAILADKRLCPTN